MMRTVFRVMRDMKTMQFFWLLVAGYVLLSLRDVFFAFSMGDVLDCLIGKNPGGLANALWRMVISGLVSIPLQVLVSCANGMLGAKGMYQFMDKHIRSLLNLPYGFYEKNHSADITNRFIADYTELYKYMSGQLGYQVCIFVYSVVTVLYLLCVNVRLTVAGYIVLPIVLLLVGRVTKKIKKQVMRQSASDAQAMIIAHDVFYARELGKVFAIPRYFRARCQELLEESSETQLKIARKNHLAQMISMLMNALPDLIVGLLGTWLVLRGEITFGTILAFVQLSNIGTAFIRHCGAFFVQGRKIAGTIARIYEVLDQSVLRRRGRNGDENGIVASFDHVDFTYDNRTNALDDVSFRVNTGEYIAIVGRSGSGKSTLLKLLNGFYFPQRGKAFVGNLSTEEWDSDGLHQYIGYVAQQPFLFDGTIKENLICGREVDEAEIREVLQLMHLEEFVNEHGGIEGTIMGKERNLSGGQAQRICIARALLRKPHLLLFDEPTSALDKKTEQIVSDVLERIGSTRILVTHRLKSVRHADRIYVMDQGRIVACGAHEELLASCPLYREISEES